MTIDQFKEYAPFVSQMRSLQASDFWQAMMTVLQDSHPGRVDSLSWTQEQRAYHQAKTAGYEAALKLFTTVLVEKKTQELPKSSYAPQTTLTGAK